MGLWFPILKAKYYPSDPSGVVTEHKLNVHKMDVWSWTSSQSLCPVPSGWQDCFSEKFLSGRKDSETFKNWQHQKIDFVFESTQPFVS